MNETPKANRIHIAFFGLRNAGKSTLVNAFTRQDLAIVSATPGTTTDPVSKAMEILPLGPCLVTDTAGLDDIGELGAQRVRKTLDVLSTTDVAVWVWEEGSSPSCGRLGRSPCDNVPATAADETSAGRVLAYDRFLRVCRDRHVAVLEYRRGESVDALREKIAALRIVDDTPGLLDGLVQAGDRVVCVCPIDASAPKGRLILPQVQVIRAALDLHATCHVCQVEELSSLLAISNPQSENIERQSEGRTLQSEGRTLQSKGRTLQSKGRTLQSECRTLQSAICNLQSENGKTVVITDSQAFGEVREVVRRATRDVMLTSFSILFARQKGDLDEYVKGLAALRALKDGDTVLVAEGCTHHRQCNDIGTVKIPKALEKLSGKKLNFSFASGGDFWVRSGDVRRETREAERLETKDPQSNNQAIKQSNVSLVVQCGGCMLTRREVLRRIGVARDAGIPIVNYGMVLAAAAGIEVGSDVCCLSSPRADKTLCGFASPRAE